MKHTNKDVISNLSTIKNSQELKELKTAIPNRFKGLRGLNGTPGPGRPKGTDKLSLTTLLRNYLWKDSKKEARQLIASVVERAQKGNSSLALEIFNRIDGKVPDKVETTGHVVYELVCYAGEQKSREIDVNPKEEIAYNKQERNGLAIRESNI